MAYSNNQLNDSLTVWKENLLEDRSAHHQQTQSQTQYQTHGHTRQPQSQSELSRIPAKTELEHSVSRSQSSIVSQRFQGQSEPHSHSHNPHAPPVVSVCGVGAASGSSARTHSSESIESLKKNQLHKNSPRLLVANSLKNLKNSVAESSHCELPHGLTANPALAQTSSQSRPIVRSISSPIPVHSQASVVSTTMNSTSTAVLPASSIVPILTLNHSRHTSPPPSPLLSSSASSSSSSTASSSLAASASSASSNDCRSPTSSSFSLLSTSASDFSVYDDTLDISLRSLLVSSRSRQLVYSMMKEIVVLALPVSLSYLLHSTLSVITYIFLGHRDPSFLGGAALGSMYVTVTGISFVFGLASAIDTLCSQAFGSGQRRLVGLLALRAAVLLTLLSIPIFFLWYFCDSVLLFLGQDPVTSDLAGRFTRISTYGLLPLVHFEVIRKFLQAQKIINPMIWIGVLANFFHVAVCYLLLFYWDLGFDGAAYATVLSDTFTLVCGLIALKLLNVTAVSCPETIPISSLFKGWKQIISLGIPGMLMLCLEWWCFEVCSLLAGLIGRVELDAFVVILSVVSYCFMIPLGISTSTSTLTGILLGAGKPKQARLVTFAAVILGMGLVVILAVLVLMFRGDVSAIFTDDDLVAKEVANLTPIAVVEIVFDGLQAIVSGALRGAGKQEIGAIANGVGYYIVGIPISAVLAFGPWRAFFREQGLLLGLVTGVIFTSIVLLFALSGVDWNKEAKIAKERIDSTADASQHYLPIEGVDEQLMESLIAPLEMTALNVTPHSPSDQSAYKKTDEQQAHEGNVNGISTSTSSTTTGRSVVGVDHRFKSGKKSLAMSMSLSTANQSNVETDVDGEGDGYDVDDEHSWLKGNGTNSGAENRSRPQQR